MKKQKLMYHWYSFVNFLTNLFIGKKLKITALEKRLSDQQSDYRMLIKKYDKLLDKYECLKIDMEYPAKFKVGDHFDGIKILKTYIESEEDFRRRKLVNIAFCDFQNAELRRERVYEYIDIYDKSPKTQKIFEKQLQEKIEKRLQSVIKK